LVNSSRVFLLLLADEWLRYVQRLKLLAMAFDAIM